MKGVNVAVWGLGPHAIKNILPALASVPQLALAGVCSRNSDVVAAAQSAYACRSWNDADAMFADPTIDVVYVSTPIGLHALHGKTVLLAGKHLWCEKPLAETSAQAGELVTLSRERSLTLAEGMMYLYHPQFIFVQQALASGRLGTVQSVTCRFGVPALARPGFRMNPALGGGAFFDVGSYPVSAVVSLFPDADPEIAFSEIFTSDGSPVDTAGRAVLRYDGGLRATLEWQISTAYRNEIDVWGTEGSLTTDKIFSKPADYVPHFRFRDRHGQEQAEAGRSENHFVGMFSAFRSLIDDRDRAEQERLIIMQRSRLMDRIRQHSRV